MECEIGLFKFFYTLFLVSTNSYYIAVSQQLQQGIHRSGKHKNQSKNKLHVLNHILKNNKQAHKRREK